MELLLREALRSHHRKRTKGILNVSLALLLYHSKMQLHGIARGQAAPAPVKCPPVYVPSPLSVLVHRSLWPSAKNCEACWNGSPQVGEPPSWSESEVLKVLQGTFSCPAAVHEGPDAPSRSWAVTCVLVCAAAAVLMWARKRFEMRGIGMDKKRVDAGPR